MQCCEKGSCNKGEDFRIKGVEKVWEQIRQVKLIPAVLGGEWEIDEWNKC